jgi:hypothetical protein
MLPMILPYLLSRAIQPVDEDDNPTHPNANLTSSSSSANSTEDIFLNLIASPFQSQVRPMHCPNGVSNDDGRY